MCIFKGSGVAIITPFTKGAVDKDSLGNLLERQIAQGTDAIIICGTTGEASTMTDEEQLDTIKFTVDKVNKRIPVIAGVGSNDTAHAIFLSKEAEKLGSDGLLSVTPYYNKTTQKGLYKHFWAIADSVHIPIILYNVPSRTGVNLLPSTVADLSKHPNIKGIKEASGNITQVAEVSRVTPDDFCLYSGNDDMIVPLLSVGGSGVISVVANIAPKDTHDMVMKYLDGDTKGACELQLRMKPLIDALFVEVNPIPVKTAVNLLGMNGGILRAPLCEMEEKNLEILKSEMQKYGLI